MPAPSARTTPGGGGAWPDVLLALALLLGGIAYVGALPRVLGAADEGLYLYEAQQLLAGQVFYRDIFDLITPGAHYLMAGLFWIFGTDMATARMADAVIHGLIVVVTYTSCRVLGVRRGLAVPAALLHLAVFQPAWAVASPHWLATLLGLLLVPVLVLRREGGGLLAGVLTGLVVAVQQQKGTMMAVGVAAVTVAGYLVDRYRGTRAAGWGAPARQLAAFLGGMLLIVVPLVAGLVAMAGVESVYRALVLHPLVNYRRHAAGAPWGYLGPFGWYARYTLPTLLPYQPVLTGLVALRALGELVGRADPERLRRSVLLVLMSLASIASISYFPDYIHLAFIGPVFAILLADLAEGGLAAFARWPLVARGTGRVVTALLLAVVGFQLRRVMTGSWRDYPFAYRSPFGVVRFHDRAEVERVERVRAVLGAAGVGEMFVYPGGTALYLLTGTTNPTPYQFMIPGYSRPDQMEDAVAILEKRRVQFVADVFPLIPGQRVDDYVLHHYEAVPDAEGKPLLFRRVEPGAGAAALP